MFSPSDKTERFVCSVAVQDSAKLEDFQSLRADLESLKTKYGSLSITVSDSL